jgi:hypothetical protein
MARWHILLFVILTIISFFMFRPLRLVPFALPWWIPLFKACTYDPFVFFRLLENLMIRCLRWVYFMSCSICLISLLVPLLPDFFPSVNSLFFLEYTQVG